MESVLDSVLVRRSQAGDLEPFRELARRHCRAVRALVWSHHPEPGRAGAAEAAVAVFQDAWRLLFTLKDVTWFPLFVLRHARLRLEAGDLPGAAAGAQRPPGEEGAENDAALQALAALPAPQREVRALYHALGRPPVQVLMEYTGLSRDALEGRLARSRVLLAQAPGRPAGGVERALDALCAAPREEDEALADRVAASIAADPRLARGVRRGPRLPPLPMPLAMALALAVAAVVVGLILRALPPPG